MTHAQSIIEEMEKINRSESINILQSVECVAEILEARKKVVKYYRTAKTDKERELFKSLINESNEHIKLILAL